MGWKNGWATSRLQFKSRARDRSVCPAHSRIYKKNEVDGLMFVKGGRTFGQVYRGYDSRPNNSIDERGLVKCITRINVWLLQLQMYSKNEIRNTNELILWRNFLRDFSEISLPKLKAILKINTLGSIL